LPLESAQTSPHPAIRNDPMAPKLTLHATRSGVLALSLLIWPTLAWPTPVSTTPIDIPGQFPDATLSNWKERSFAGNTKYRLVEEDGVNVLRADTQSSASILYREREIDLRRFPILEWSWKVAQVYSMIDERSKAGDDFPARVYVVARTGWLPWETLAINYVWASEAMVDERWPNPFTEKAMMIAANTGAGGVGQWVRHRRDVRADFKAAFGKQVDRISGYAVMVDGDNSNQDATAWFGDLAFLPR